MTISTRTVIKSYFETGDKPTQAQFSDFIDSTLFYEDTSDFGRALISASAAASARTLLGSGSVGDKVFTAITTASAQQNIGGGTVGRRIFEAVATASALTELGGGIVGINVFSAITTASAQDQLGGGAVGKAVFEAITTASAQSQLAVPTTASPAEQQSGITGSKYVSPSNQQFHPSAVKVRVRVVVTAGVPAIDDSDGVSSVSDLGVGQYQINFTQNFATEGIYSSLMTLEQATNSFCYTLADGLKPIGSERVAIKDGVGFADDNFCYFAGGNQL